MLSCFSRVRLCATLWTVVSQAPQFMGFSRPEYWSGLRCPSPGDLPNPGIESGSLNLLHWQAGSLSLAPPEKDHARYPVILNTEAMLGQSGSELGSLP